MKQLLLFFTILIISISAHPQGTDYDYDRIKIGEANHFVSGLALSPDQSTLAISGMQNFPFYVFDWENEQVIDIFDVGNWYAGSAIQYSSNGNYILLGKLKYVDFALNKDREVDYEIINAKNGDFVKKFNAQHAVQISSDEKYAVTLNGNEVGFWNLASGKKEKSFSVHEATNSVALSPDGKFIVVSHKLYEEDAKQISQLQRDKKTLKNALKYKQQLSVYDASSFKKLYTINELYEIVYKLAFSKDGKSLFCLHIPHTNIQNNATRQMYVNVVNMETSEPKRRGFTSQAPYEPDFKLSNNGKYFGIVSRSNKFIELHIYDFETGKMANRFQLNYRLFEKNDGGMVAPDSRSSFVFLPDNKSVIMTMGNHLIKWNFESNE